MLLTVTCELKKHTYLERIKCKPIKPQASINTREVQIFFPFEGISLSFISKIFPFPLLIVFLPAAT